MRLCLSLCVVSVLASLPAAADVTLPGFALSRTPNIAATAVACSLPDGDFVSFDGARIERRSADGTLEELLGVLASPVFPSFVRLVPAGDAVIIGDSGTFSPIPAGDLHKVALDGSGVTLLGSIPFNFDGEFLPNGDLLVTAAPNGFSAGNDFFRVQLAPYSATHVGHFDGPSGPIAIARSGDIFYGTQQDPSLPNAPQSILRWSASLLQAGTFLDASNASVYASGFEPPSALEFEPVRERLVMAENRYGSSYRIRRVRPTGQTSPVLLSADNWISSMRFVRGGSAATFDAYQPDDGVAIAYTTTDFWTLDDLVTLAPQRPALTISGAGTSGQGAVSLALSGGVPNGTALLTYCAQSAMFPSEQTYPLPGFYLHTPFLLSATTRTLFLVPTDASGAVTLQLWNPGGLEGQFGWQFHVGRTNGALIGSSNAEQF